MVRCAVLQSGTPKEPRLGPAVLGRVHQRFRVRPSGSVFLLFLTSLRTCTPTSSTPAISCFTPSASSPPWGSWPPSPSASAPPPSPDYPPTSSGTLASSPCPPPSSSPDCS